MKMNYMTTLMAVVVASDLMVLPAAYSLGKYRQEAADRAKMKAEVTKAWMDGERQGRVVAEDTFMNILAQSSQKETKKEFKKHTVSDDTVNVVRIIEGARPRSVSHRGATGLMQIREDTWDWLNHKYFGDRYPYRPYAKNSSVNLKFGRKYLEYLNSWLDSESESWNANQAFLLFVAYNGGMGNLKKNGFDPVTLKKKCPVAYDYAERACNLLGVDVGG